MQGDFFILSKYQIELNRLEKHFQYRIMITISGGTYMYTPLNTLNFYDYAFFFFVWSFIAFIFASLFTMRFFLFIFFFTSCFMFIFFVCLIFQMYDYIFNQLELNQRHKDFTILLNPNYRWIQGQNMQQRVVTTQKRSLKVHT